MSPRARAHTSDDPLRLDRQICFALYNASRAVTRAYSPLLAPLGLTYPQYLALLVLWEEEGISVKQLGACLALDSATLTPLLKRLEKQRLIERRRDAQDERVVRIHLSQKGRVLREKARSVPASLARRAGFRLADPLSRARLSQLRETLNSVSRELESVV